MWILESTGDFLDGKRLWLRPGRKYLFGRVKRDGVRFAIDHKTVSRKHFVIDVAEVEDSEVSQIHARTKIKIIDQNSKSGTYVNGNHLKGDDLPSRDLPNAENSVRPGNLPHELIIRWQPCVLTFHLLKKDQKAGVLKTKQDRLKPMGIKTINDFASEFTTHLVASKRNTPKGLQALICGKYLVADSYVDALEYASTPTNLDEEEDASLLERDFDKAWPAPKDHLPPPGREATVRPIETYEPDPSRTTIFQDYTFVFGDQSQYDNLLPVITTGHGKALLFKVIHGETTIDEAYQFISNAAGRKTFGDPGVESEKGGVIMVRWVPAAEHAEWAGELINQLALKIDQRAIDQSEFLDAILANDASLLRQSIPFESNIDGRVAPPSSAVQSFASVRQSSQGQVNGEKSDGRTNGDGSVTRSQPSQSQQINGNGTQPSQRGRTQAVSQQQAEPVAVESQAPPRRERFKMPPPTQKAFDDGFDENAIIYDDNDVEEEPSQVDDSEPEVPLKSEPQSTRKRRRSSSPDLYQKAFEDDMEELLPAATAMKKRKLEREAEAKQQGLPSPFPSKSSASVKKPRKPEKEIDVREVARAQREKEREAARRAQEDEDRLPAFDETDREPANLVIIHDLPVRESKPAPRTGRSPKDDPRWDPKWNDKKNFKRFQPQQRGTVRLSDRATKTIVPLAPVKKVTGGLGEKYWDKSQEEKDAKKKRKKKEKQRSQRTQSGSTQTQTAKATGSTQRVNEIVTDDDQEDEARRPSPAATRLQEEAAAIVDHEIDIESPRRTRGDDARSQTQRETETQARGTKRPAPATKAPAPKKRQKTLPVTTVHGSDSEIDDDDGTKFKFGTRKKKGRA